MWGSHFDMKLYTVQHIVLILLRCKHYYLNNFYRHLRHHSNFRIAVLSKELDQLPPSQPNILLICSHLPLHSQLTVLIQTNATSIPPFLRNTAALSSGELAYDCGDQFQG
jgi:hypothetical protein